MPKISPKRTYRKKPFSKPTRPLQPTTGENTENSPSAAGDTSASAPFLGTTIGTATSTTLSAALYYRDRGCIVVPCCTMNDQGQCTFAHVHITERSIGKVPLFSNWPLVRLTREEVINWWTQYPAANVGVLLEPSNLLIIDTDSDEAEEEAIRFGLPPGPQVKTGAGRHHYYKNPKALIANTTRQGESGKIDILASGIVIGFGSIHRSSKPYSLLTTWEDWPLEDAPLWAEQLLQDAIKAKSMAAFIPDNLPPVDVYSLRIPSWLSPVVIFGQPQGQDPYPSRSEAVWAVTTALVEAGHSDAEIASVLLDPNYKISAKPLEQGTRWLAGEIGRARAKAQISPSQEESEPQGGGGEDTTMREETVSTPQGEGDEDGDEDISTPQEAEDAANESGTQLKSQPKTSAAFGFDTYNGLTLRNKDFPPLQEAIPDLLPIGLTVLAGPPKLGKSFLVLNIACAIAAGGKAFSRFDLQGGDCLYLALEDSPRRMQNRLLSLLGDYEEWPDRLPDFVHTAPLSGAGLEDLITRWVVTHPSARLVIIDTLAKVKPPRQRGQDPYQEDYRISARLQQLALKHDIAILLVHHTKKGPEEDFLSAVSGTYGVTGGADAVWVLKRKRGQQEGTLSVTGRDIEERDLAMKTTDGDWLCLGDATEARRSASRKQILDVLLQANLTPAEIATVTKMNRATVRRLLMKMLSNGEVFKVAEQYTLLPPQGGE